MNDLVQNFKPIYFFPRKSASPSDIWILENKNNPHEKYVAKIYLQTPVAEKSKSGIVNSDQLIYESEVYKYIQQNIV